MKILIDTSVWSVALRKGNSENAKPYQNEIQNLTEEGRIYLIGPVRQELLSGIKNKAQFEQLKAHLDYFPDLPLLRSFYELAAELYNHCRSRGVQGSHIDFLICAAAIVNKAKIFTLDRDFLHFSKIIDITLHEFEQC